ncbi:hypothetical protein [Vibrio lentus]|uniref:PFGI-1 class ICE element type IV pilus protein PilL2 n=1 Tax=Vibrio lentus TaxID=136468 RepID=UPI0013000777|nr:hypothetical protein [Vibrio lentus]
MQTSRYVIERSAGEQMTDILGVPIEARLPVMSKMSIKDGVEFLLSGSGVSLRTPTSYAETQLYAQPLPLGHTDMGHMSLRQALQVIGGQAFSLEEDVVRRNVGFRLKYGYEWQAPKPVTGYSDGKSPLAGTVKASKVAATSSLSSSPKDAQPSVVMTPKLKKSLASKSASSETMSSFEDDNDALFASDTRVKPSTSKAKPTPSKSSVKKKALTTYRVHAGESFRSALTRWAYKHGDQPLAFAQDEAFLTALDGMATQDFVRTGSLSGAVKALSASNPSLNTLTLYSNILSKLMAFHPWKGERVTTLMVSGDTLKAATKQVTGHYGWRWDEKSSWPVADFTFTPYPLVTKEGDISMAMTTLLGPYPLKAQRLDATKTIYIKEVTPL